MTKCHFCNDTGYLAWNIDEVYPCACTQRRKELEAREISILETINRLHKEILDNEVELKRVRDLLRNES